MSKKNTKEKNSPHKIDQGIFQKPSKKLAQLVVREGQ